MGVKGFSRADEPLLASHGAVAGDLGLESGFARHLPNHFTEDPRARQPLLKPVRFQLLFEAGFWQGFAWR
jgi:hypothetical protein